ncbi:hypothetical protein BDD12DRAFT_878014 [Trichophaea hybrida]|nr:hypothetical protein BDD12DRAFT_878014 [Trichophaea hybrida]
MDGNETVQRHQPQPKKIAKLERENAEMKHINDKYVKAQKNHIAPEECKHTSHTDMSNEGIIGATINRSVKEKGSVQQELYVEIAGLALIPPSSVEILLPVGMIVQLSAFRTDKAPQIYQEAHERASRKNDNVMSILSRNESLSSVDALPESVVIEQYKYRSVI